MDPVRVKLAITFAILLFVGWLSTLGDWIGWLKKVINGEDDDELF